MYGSGCASFSKHFYGSGSETDPADIVSFQLCLIRIQTFQYFPFYGIVIPQFLDFYYFQEKFVSKSQKKIKTFLIFWKTRKFSEYFVKIVGIRERTWICVFLRIRLRLGSVKIARIRIRVTLLLTHLWSK